MSASNELPTLAELDAVLKWLPALERPAQPLYQVLTASLDPYVYSDDVLGLLRELRRTKLITPFDWMQWTAQADQLTREPALLAAADLPTLQRLITTHTRRERFESGHLAQLLDNGQLVALLRRLAAIRDELAAASVPSTPRVPAPRARLLYRDPQGHDAAVELPPGGAYLGRSAECIVRTGDALAGRKNAKISLVDGRWLVEDLHSPNGTFVNGDKIQNQALTHGDVIHCASLQVRFVQVAATEPIQGSLVPARADAPAENLVNGTGGRHEAEAADPPAGGGWVPSLQVRTEPPGGEARLPSGDWRQDAEGAEPLWARTAGDLMRRVSIENGSGLYALCLFQGRGGESYTPLLDLGGWSRRRRYRIGQVEAARPVEEGFLRRLRLWVDREAPEQPVDPPTLLQEFCTAERARIGDLEQWLRGHYGRPRPVGEVFGWIDYPSFDNGTMEIGFAVLLHGPELHVFSRCVHAHK